MFKSRVTEMLGIKYPIIGGTMMYVSKPELVAAISDAGGLGILPSANFKDMEVFRDALKKVQDLTDKPFAVNLNQFPAIQQMDNNLYLDVMEEENVNIVETSGHKAPDDLEPRIHKAGQTLIHKCVAPRYAKKAESIGADAVTVVGWENGGATGILDLATTVLVPKAVDAVDIPVIGGGGVGDGRGIAGLLALGAEAVIIGTLFMSAEETGLHPSVMEEMIRRNEADTELVLRAIGNSHRVLKNEASKKYLELEERGAGLDEMLPIIIGENTRQMFEEGDVDKGLFYIGQTVGFIDKVRPARQIVEDLMAETEQALTKLNEMFGININGAMSA